MSTPMTPAEAAEYIGKTTGTLNTYRYNNQGPAYYRVSEAKYARVFYLREDLDQWLQDLKDRRKYDLTTAIRIDPAEAVTA